MTNQDETRWERLAALGVKREIPTPEGEAKMSAVVLQLALGRKANCGTCDCFHPWSRNKPSIGSQ